MVEAVIFDFDGVVADTMGDNFRAWEKVFLEYGVKIFDVDYFLLEGMGRYEIAQFFVEKYDLDGHLIETMVQKKERYYKLDNHFRIYNEVPEILKLLNSRKIKVGLVTGASRDRIETTLTGDIRKYFNVIITSDEVKNGKPHPEPYLKAIQKLQCNPGSTIVIENAKLGIQAAKAAGCNCIAVQTTLGKEYLTEADEVFNNHHEIFCYFKTNNYEHSEN